MSNKKRIGKDSFDVYERESFYKKYINYGKVVKIENMEPKHPIEFCYSYRPVGINDDDDLKSKKTTKPKYLIMGTIPSLMGQNEGFYHMSSRSNFWEYLEKTLHPKSNNHKSNYYEQYKDYLECKKIESKERINKSDEKEECIKNIVKQLKRDKITLFDTVKCCYRSNGRDTGIIYQCLQDKKDIYKLCGKNTTFILLSDDARKNFENIIDDDEYKSLVNRKKIKIVSSPSGNNNDKNWKESWNAAFKR